MFREGSTQSQFGQFHPKNTARGWAFTEKRLPNEALGIQQVAALLNIPDIRDPLGQRDRAATWPLRPSEVAVMDLATEDALRGRGLAVRLMQATTSAHLARGKSRVIAFIWWSNTPSLRALTKAGWRRIGLSVEVLVAGKWLALRLPLPA